METAVHTWCVQMCIRDRLGKGGMSVVYRAEDSVLGREVALKLLNDTYAGDALRSERFELEAQILSLIHIWNLPGEASVAAEVH